MGRLTAEEKKIIAKLLNVPDVPESRLDLKIGVYNFHNYHVKEGLLRVYQALIVMPVLYAKKEK